MIKINGSKVSINQKPGSYIILNRRWKSGDKIEVAYPMTLHLIPTPDNPQKAAIAFGPVLLGGAMGTEGLKEPAPYAKDQDDLKNFVIPGNIIHELNTNGTPVSNWLKAVPNEALTFKTVNATPSGDVTLIPYYKLHHQRYVLYWDLK
jgi:DUF1680 family protein